MVTVTTEQLMTIMERKNQLFVDALQKTNDDANRVAELKLSYHLKEKGLTRQKQNCKVSCSKEKKDNKLCCSRSRRS